MTSTIKLSFANEPLYREFNPYVERVSHSMNVGRKINFKNRGDFW
jgi:hypothetical protein